MWYFYRLGVRNAGRGEGTPDGLGEMGEGEQESIIRSGLQPHGSINILFKLGKAKRMNGSEWGFPKGKGGAGTDCINLSDYSYSPSCASLSANSEAIRQKSPNRRDIAESKRYTPAART